MTFRSGTLFTPVLALGALSLLSACMSPPPQRPAIDPDTARSEIARRLPAKVENRTGWAVDIFAALEALDIPPTPENFCAVIAIAEQESSLRADPAVPGLPTIARKEIDARAASHHIPGLAVDAALSLQSPNGKSYRERLENAHTEKDLSDLYEDFIGMVPLGGRLFADLNPVHTAGPMQVSISYSEAHAEKKHYPYPVSGNIRHEVFTRRGGIYFGTAHLLDYRAMYDEMLYRFADYNAGHYSSRNAAFQSAVSAASGTRLALDGDLLRHGSGASEPSNTEVAIRKVAAKIDLSEVQIRRDLGREDDYEFADTKVYERVFALADKTKGRPLPRALLPQIRLESPKITRKLTTDWFAHRVDERYRQCLKR